jgi:hypothetical protein
LLRAQATGFCEPGCQTPWAARETASEVRAKHLHYCHVLSLSQQSQSVRKLE